MPLPKVVFKHWGTMRKTLTALITGALLASMPAIGHAQRSTEVTSSPEKVALVKRYLAAVHFEQMMSGIVGQMTPAILHKMRKSQPNITDAEFRAVTEAITESSTDFIGSLDSGLRGYLYHRRTHQDG